MTDNSDGPTAIAERVNGFDELYPRHVGGAKYSVLSTRGGKITAHTVNIEQLTCGCEDEVYNLDGHEVCDHVAVALHAAPKRLSIDNQSFQYVMEALGALRDARQNGPVTYPASEVMEPDGADSGDAAADTDGSSGPDQSAVEAAVGSVEAWLVDVDVDHESVQVWVGDHDGTDGVRVDWMKDDLGEKDHEFLKSKINAVDGTTYHAGWMDDGCRTCGESDGEGFYHFPVSTARRL